MEKRIQKKRRYHLVLRANFHGFMRLVKNPTPGKLPRFLFVSIQATGDAFVMPSMGKANEWIIVHHFRLRLADNHRSYICAGCPFCHPDALDEKFAALAARALTGVHSEVLRWREEHVRARQALEAAVRRILILGTERKPMKHGER